jgi:glutamine amidotransferase
MDIAIIDYGVGNLRSAEKAFQHLGADAALTREPKDLAGARKIVLPGVGNFRECMERRKEHGFVAPLIKEVEKGKPLLWICVGLQMLFEGSEESPGVAGLGLLKGRVRKFAGEAFRRNEALKIPQIGWNGLTFPGGERHALFADVPPGAHVYFVHSFYCLPDEIRDVLAWSDYGGDFCASAGRDNVMGVQFHPEKSQRVGLGILGNFVRAGENG